LINRCYICGINEWRGMPLVLRLDHINGVNDDYRLENLRLLCPNCDSQTDTYCGRNRVKKQPSICKCGNVMHKDSLRCRPCSFKVPNRGREPKVEWPPLDELLTIIKDSSFVATGKLLGVSDQAIRKHIKRRLT